MTHHGSSTHSDGNQKSYISTVVVTNAEKGSAVKKHQHLSNDYGTLSDSQTIFKSPLKNNMFMPETELGFKTSFMMKFGS